MSRSGPFLLRLSRSVFPKEFSLLDYLASTSVLTSWTTNIHIVPISVNIKCQSGQGKFDLTGRKNLMDIDFE